MSEFKGTPGPWETGPTFDWDIVTEDDSPVAQADTNNTRWPENAHLIAAAPDLLAALAPFVKLAERFAILNDGGSRDECPWPNSGELTLADLRRVVEAIAKAVQS